MNLLSLYLRIINTNLNIQLSSKDSTYLMNNNLFMYKNNVYNIIITTMYTYYSIGIQYSSSGIIIIQ